MKRTFKVLCLLGLLSLGLTSCSRGIEELYNGVTPSYTNPRRAGGTYTVYQNTLKFEHLKCVYWSTEDDDSVFEDANGNLYYVNGSSIIVKE